MDTRASPPVKRRRMATFYPPNPRVEDVPPQPSAASAFQPVDGDEATGVVPPPSEEIDNLVKSAGLQQQQELQEEDELFKAQLEVANRKTERLLRERVAVRRTSALTTPAPTSLGSGIVHHERIGGRRSQHVDRQYDDRDTARLSPTDPPVLEVYVPVERGSDLNNQLPPTTDSHHHSPTTTTTVVTDGSSYGRHSSKASRDTGITRMHDSSRSKKRSYREEVTRLTPTAMADNSGRRSDMERPFSPQQRQVISPRHSPPRRRVSAYGEGRYEETRHERYRDCQHPQPTRRHSLRDFTDVTGARNLDFHHYSPHPSATLRSSLPTRSRSPPSSLYDRHPVPDKLYSQELNQQESSPPMSRKAVARKQPPLQSPSRPATEDVDVEFVRRAFANDEIIMGQEDKKKDEKKVEKTVEKKDGELTKTSATSKPEPHQQQDSPSGPPTPPFGKRVFEDDSVDCYADLPSGPSAVPAERHGQVHDAELDEILSECNQEFPDETMETRVKDTYEKIAAVWPKKGYVPELASMESSLLAHKYCEKWAPRQGQPVHLLVLEASPVFTDPSIAGAKAGGMGEFHLGHLNTPYCLSYGEAWMLQREQVSQLPSCRKRQVEAGSKNFWRLLSTLAGEQDTRDDRDPLADVDDTDDLKDLFSHLENSGQTNESRLDAKKRVLSTLRDRGIVLANVSPVSVGAYTWQATMKLLGSQKTLFSLCSKDYKRIMKIAWEEYTKHMIEIYRPKNILVLGKKVEQAIGVTALSEAADNVGGVYIGNMYGPNNPKVGGKSSALRVARYIALGAITGEHLTVTLS